MKKERHATALSGCSHTLIAATASAVCSVWTAGDVCRFGNRLQLIDQVCILCALAVCQFFVLQTIPQILHHVGVDQCSGRLAFCMDRVGDLAGLLRIFVANSIDVAVSFAAAVLLCKTVFCYCSFGAEKAVQDPVVHCIESIAQTVLDSQHGSV